MAHDNRKAASSASKKQQPLPGADESVSKVTQRIQIAEQDRS